MTAFPVTDRQQRRFAGTYSETMLQHAGRAQAIDDRARQVTRGNGTAGGQQQQVGRRQAALRPRQIVVKFVARDAAMQRE